MWKVDICIERMKTKMTLYKRKEKKDQEKWKKTHSESKGNRIEERTDLVLAVENRKCVSSVFEKRKCVLSVNDRLLSPRTGTCAQWRNAFYWAFWQRFSIGTMMARIMSIVCIDCSMMISLSKIIIVSKYCSEMKELSVLSSED